MNISEQIENDIITLKEKRYSDEKIKQYDLIASRIGEFLKNTKTKKFQKSLIISFFSTRFYPLSTQRKHIKNIIDVMKDKGLITDGKLQKIGKQQRVYSLSSDDKQSYSAMMKANGFNSVGVIFSCPPYF